MRFLITNDDGYEDTGIAVLQTAVRAMGHEAVVVAPEENCSGKSHAMSLGPIRVRRVRDDQMETYAVLGTPADCVRIALSGYLEGQFDGVLSGVNHGGFNAGADIIVSGTVGAARQGAFSGLPSIALSSDAEDAEQWRSVGRLLISHFSDWLQEANAPSHFLNINIPHRAKGTWLWSTLSDAAQLTCIRKSSHAQDGDWITFHYSANLDDGMPMSDRHIVATDRISVTKINCLPSTIQVNLDTITA